MPKLNIFMGNISIDWTPTPKFGVFNARLTLPWSREELMAELHNADWGSTNESATYEGHWNNGARFKVYDRQSTPIMAALHDYFSGPEYRQKLIAHFYEQMPKFFLETLS